MKPCKVRKALMFMLARRQLILESGSVLRNEKIVEEEERALRTALESLGLFEEERFRDIKERLRKTFVPPKASRPATEPEVSS